MRRAAALALLAALGLATGCGGRPTTSTPAPGAAAAVHGSITVFAAASLTEAFRAIGTAWEAAHPGAQVTFSFDASSALVAQLAQGAPADVFASADTVTMAKLVSAGLAEGAPTAFAGNRLEIVVPAGNPRRITGLADLVTPGLQVVLCDAAVPCGRYAAEVLARSDVRVTPVSLEQNVKGVLTKVTAGEADAGIVYATDVRAAGDRTAGVAIPEPSNVRVSHPAAVTTSSGNPVAARSFVSFLTSTAAQTVLARHGFTAP
jgi:molybdate transport system substrate-binding protein